MTSNVTRVSQSEKVVEMPIIAATLLDRERQSSTATDDKISRREITQGVRDPCTMTDVDDVTNFAIDCRVDILKLLFESASLISLVLTDMNLCKLLRVWELTVSSRKGRESQYLEWRNRISVHDNMETKDESYCVNHESERLLIRSEYPTNNKTLKESVSVHDRSVKGRYGKDQHLGLLQTVLMCKTITVKIEARNSRETKRKVTWGVRYLESVYAIKRTKPPDLDGRLFSHFGYFRETGSHDRAHLKTYDARLDAKLIHSRSDVIKTRDVECMQTRDVKRVENDVTKNAQDTNRANLDLQEKVSDRVKLGPLTSHCQRSKDTDVIQNVSGSLKLLEVETSRIEIGTSRNILNLTSTLESLERSCDNRTLQRHTYWLRSAKSNYDLRSTTPYN